MLCLIFNAKAQHIIIDTVIIQDQVWMVENLNVVRFRNGDPIPEAKSNEEWKNAAANKQPAWCFYNNDSILGTKTGKLYNYYAIEDPRGLAPYGWHVATDIEWTMLVDYFGGQNKAGEQLKSKRGWYGRNGSNLSGFDARSGGWRDEDGKFTGYGTDGRWWILKTRGLAYRSLNHKDGYVNYSDYHKGYPSENDILSEVVDGGNGFSIRCIKD